MKLALFICIGLYVFTHFFNLFFKNGFTQAEKYYYWNNNFSRRIIIGIAVIHYGSLWIGIILGLIFIYQNI